MFFDILIIGFVSILVIKGFSQGLIRTALSGVFKILTVVSGYIVAGRYALEISEKYVYNIFYKNINEYISKNINLTQIVKEITQKVEESDSSFSIYLDILPAEQLTQIANLDIDSAIESLTNSISQSISYSVTYGIIFILTVILVSIAFRMILKVIDTILGITNLKSIDKILGAVLNGAIGIFISCMIVWTIITVSPLSTVNDGIFANTQNNMVLPHIIDNKPKFFNDFIN